MMETQEKYCFCIIFLGDDNVGIYACSEKRGTLQSYRDLLTGADVAFWWLLTAAGTR
jgi:hypothetical protein